MKVARTLSGIGTCLHTRKSTVSRPGDTGRYVRHNAQSNATLILLAYKSTHTQTHESTDDENPALDGHVSGALKVASPLHILFHSLPRSASPFQNKENKRVLTTYFRSTNRPTRNLRSVTIRLAKNTSTTSFVATIAVAAAISSATRTQAMRCHWTRAPITTHVAR